MSIRIKRKFGIEEDLCEKKYSRLEDSLSWLSNFCVEKKYNWMKNFQKEISDFCRSHLKVDQLPSEIWGKVIGHLDPLSLTKGMVSWFFPNSSHN